MYFSTNLLCFCVFFFHYLILCVVVVFFPKSHFIFLYLILISGNYTNWKKGLESKGLRVNMGKTNVMSATGTLLLLDRKESILERFATVTVFCKLIPYSVAMVAQET